LFLLSPSFGSKKTQYDTHRLSSCRCHLWCSGMDVVGGSLRAVVDDRKSGAMA